MLAELIMARLGWSDVWVPTIGDPENPPPGRVRHSTLAAFKGRGFHVGVWTGPDGDMHCVRRCATKSEAERYMSPPGRFILDAALRSLAVRIANDVARHFQEIELRAWLKAHPR